jgi:hypothetical protein
MIDNVEIKARFEPILSVDDILKPIPTEFVLRQNYPNPFNPETTIEYQLAKDCQVEITVYNINGQEVVNLVNDEKAAGAYSLIWNAMDESGSRVPSGVYLYRISTPYYNDVRKMILLR